MPFIHVIVYWYNHILFFKINYGVLDALILEC